MLARTVRPLLDKVEPVMFGCEPRGAKRLHYAVDAGHRKDQTLNPTESAIKPVRIVFPTGQNRRYCVNMSFEAAALAV